MAASKKTPEQRAMEAEAKAAEAARKKRAEAATIGHQRRRAREWEQSPEGQERLKDAPAHFGTKATAAQIYQVRQWEETSKGARHYEQQIPGLENPDAVPQHPRWEDLSDDERKKTERALALQAGVDLDFMERSFGAQLDQSYLRAEKANEAKGIPRSAAVPYSRDFYTEETGPGGEPGPRGVMSQGAKETGLTLGQYAAVSAITSPNAKFQQGDRFPNDETAKAVVHQARVQSPIGAAMPRRRDDPSKQSEGRPSNARKAIDAVQQFDTGVPVSAAVRRIEEVRTVKDKETGEVVTPGHQRYIEDESRRPPLLDPKSSPKVGPYHNSWLLDTPDYLVSDVHTAGGGLLPHLRHDKPVLTDASGAERISKTGQKVRDKSEREKVIERVPNFHVAADYVARQAISKRGLTSIRQAQASQWGEEGLVRKENDPKLSSMKTPDAAYSHVEAPTHEQTPGQGRLDFASGQAVPGREAIPPKPAAAVLSKAQLKKNYEEDF